MNQETSVTDQNDRNNYNQQTLLMQTNISIGYTKWIDVLIEENPSSRIMWVTDTLSRAFILARTFIARGIQCYINMKGKHCRVLLMTIDMVSEVEKEDEFDIVVLEQLGVILDRFYRMDNKPKLSFNNMIHILKKAIQVVGVDRCIDERAIWFMLRICKREQCEVYDNEQMRCNASMQRDSRTTAMKKVIKEVKKGLRVAVACSNAGYAKEIYDHITRECVQKKGMVYIQENSEEDEKNANISVDIDYLIYSPADCAIIDYAAAARSFDRMFCLLK